MAVARPFSANAVQKSSSRSVNRSIGAIVRTFIVGLLGGGWAGASGNDEQLRQRTMFRETLHDQFDLSTWQPGFPKVPRTLVVLR